MRRITAFLLSVLLLAGNMLPHLPEEQLAGLIAHYHQHQREEGPDVSVTRFLWEHYAADAFHHKHPNHSHAHLPAMDFHSGCSVFMWVNPSFLFSTPVVERAAAPCPHWENNYAFRFFSGPAESSQSLDYDFRMK